MITVRCFMMNFMVLNSFARFLRFMRILPFQALPLLLKVFLHTFTPPSEEDARDL